MKKYSKKIGFLFILAIVVIGVNISKDNAVQEQRELFYQTMDSAEVLNKHYAKQNETPRDNGIHFSPDKDVGSEGQKRNSLDPSEANDLAPKKTQFDLYLEQIEKENVEKLHQLRAATIGFACAPKSKYGYDVLIIYDGKYVSTFHDNIVDRGNDWIITTFTETNSGSRQWDIPEQKWEQFPKKLSHHVWRYDEAKFTELELLTLNESDIKSEAACFLTKVGSLRDFVNYRMGNILGNDRVFDRLE